MKKITVMLLSAGLGMVSLSSAQEEPPAAPPVGDSGGYPSVQAPTPQEGETYRPPQPAQEPESPTNPSEGNGAVNTPTAPQPANTVVETLGVGEGAAIEEERGATMSAEPSGKKSVPQEYQIQPGDTLWDVCQKLLDNPWYWPKLWALNQYIDNPHLIYPGNKLSFFPGSETAPPKLDVVDQNAPAKSKEVPSLSVAPETPETMLAGPAGERWEVPWKKPGPVKLKAISFISEKQIKDAGKITHSGEAKTQLTAGDHVYMKFVKGQPVAVGDKFTAIHVIKKIKDPESWLGKLGYLVKKDATVRVLRIYPDTVEGLITDAESAIVRSDLLIPYTSSVRTVSPHDSTKKINAQIVEGENEQYLIGNNDYVFLNKGKLDGVEAGLRMAVVRKGDGVFPEDDKDLPFVVFGRLIVVETNDHTSTAYVVDLKDSLAVGDKVVTPMPN